MALLEPQLRKRLEHALAEINTALAASAKSRDLVEELLGGAGDSAAQPAFVPLRWLRSALALSWLRRCFTSKLYRARSQLYRSQNLQVNIRFKALAEMYKMHSFAQLLESIIENWGSSALSIFCQNGAKAFATFAKFSK